MAMDGEFRASLAWGDESAVQQAPKSSGGFHVA